MVLPVIAMVGVAAAGAIAGWLNSRDAKKATEAERKRMEALLAKVQDPTFDASKISAPEYQILQKYTPQVSNWVQEAAPTQIKADSQDAMAGRDAQRAALAKLRELGTGVNDIQSEAMINEAITKANIANRGNQDAIRESMARRGLGGSGLELMMSNDSSQAAASRAAENSQAAAVEAYKRKLQSLRDSASLGGQIRDQDVDLSARNAAIINAFNQRTSSAQNDYNQYRDRTYNDAQKYNVGEAQRISEKNKSAAYDNATAERAYINSLKQQGFNNQMSKVTGHQANTAMARDDIRSNSRDNANIISGLTQGVNSAIMYGGKKKKYDYEDDEE
jgi:type II secretory pathway pseudopilin PulG